MHFQQFWHSNFGQFEHSRVNTQLLNQLNDVYLSAYPQTVLTRSGGEAYYFLGDENGDIGLVFEHMFHSIKYGRVDVDNQEIRKKIISEPFLFIVPKKYSAVTSAFVPSRSHFFLKELLTESADGDFTINEIKQIQHIIVKPIKYLLSVANFKLKFFRFVSCCYRRCKTIYCIIFIFVIF